MHHEREDEADPTDVDQMPKFCEATDGQHGCALPMGHEGAHMTLGAVYFS